MTVEVDEQERKVTTEEGSENTSEKDEGEKTVDAEKIEVEPEEEVKELKESEEDVSPQEKEAADETEDTKIVDEKPEPKSNNRTRFSFIRRLFRRSSKDLEKQQDTEAGTELLSKNKISKLDTENEPNKDTEKTKDELKLEEEENGKVSKAGSGTDVTIAVSDEKDQNNENTDTSNKKSLMVRFKTLKWRWVISGVILFLVIFILAVFLTAPLTFYTDNNIPDGSDIPLTVTSCGPVWGSKEDGVFVFRGLPYALPPLKNRRWKPPFAPAKLDDCWPGTFMALNESKHCYQKPIPGMNLDFSEDCLYLNVITPTLSYKHPRPVVVLLSGSTLHGLSSNDLHWQPTPKLASEKGVVFVTFNYRMHAFGFMALEVLSKAVYPPTSGNYGFQDQIEALKWVSKNIHHFGGDPSKVTLLAHGSGATSALVLLSSKRTRGLFQQVWLTGGSAHFTSMELKQVEKNNEGFLRNLNCSTAECLYNKSPEEILAATPNWWTKETVIDVPTLEEEMAPAVAIVDGAVLYDSPSNIWKNGNVSDTSVVIGANAQESGLMRLEEDAEQWGWGEFSSYIVDRLDKINSSVTDEILEYYMNNSSMPLEMLHSLISDVRVVCPLQHLTEQFGQGSKNSVRFYVNNYKPSAHLNYSENTAPMAIHGMDVVAILDLVDQYMAVMPQDESFTETMQDLFYSYVMSGIPKSRGTSLKECEYFNTIGTAVASTRGSYNNCKVWEEPIFSKYARMN